MGIIILSAYSVPSYCQKSLNNLTMSLPQITSHVTQNIFQSILLHSHDEEHSGYYYDDFTVFWEINSVETQDTQNSVKVFIYENTEKSTLNIQYSIFVLDMLREIGLLLKYLLDIFW